MAFGFLKKIVKVAASPIKLSLKAAGTVTGAVGKVTGHIPIVGKPLKSVINIGNAPVGLLNHVAAGERIDKAVINNLKQQVKDIKTVAPYAKMVVSLVPGVGTGIAAGIGAGCALAEGQSITSALIAGVKSSVPGGAAGQAVFSVSNDIISGKNITTVAMNAIPLPAAQKVALKTVLDTGKAVASGKSLNAIQKAALSKAESLLPADVKKAVSIGAALGSAQKLQQTIKKNIKPAQLNTLSNIGKKAITSHPVLRAGVNTLKTNADKAGYSLAVGLMQHQITPTEVAAIQSKLTKDQATGFNMGLAAVAGLSVDTPTTTQVAVPEASTPTEAFGQAVAQGLEGASMELKTDVLNEIKTSPEAVKGVVTVAAVKGSWWHKLLVNLGFIHEEKAA